MEASVQSITLITAADLSAKQYYCVKVDAAGKAALCGAGEPGVGILQDPMAAGYAARVMALGISYAIYGGAVTAGDKVASDAAGKLVTAVAGDYVIGIAMETGVANEIRPVLLISREKMGVGTSYSQLCIPVVLSKVANGDILTGYVPGFAGTIESIQFFVTDPVTTANKAVDINLEIAGTNVTGGVVALTSANCTPLGARVAGTAITAANAFTAAQAIDIEAANTVAFAEGQGVLIITLKKSA